MSENSQQALQTYLQSSNTLIKQLLTLLDEEKQALIAKEAQDIEDISGKKLKLIDEITAMDHLRQRLFQQAGIEESAKGMLALIQQAPTAKQPTLQNLWQELRKNLQVCEQKIYSVAC